MKKTLTIIILSLLTLQLFSLKVPKLKGYVNDYANILNSNEETALDNYLRDFERSTSSQVALLTIESLKGENLEDYSIRVVDEWKLGQTGKDNGVLLLVSMQDKKMRIEVGYGVEGVLTDAKSRYIIDNYIVPDFKRGEFFTGISNGIGKITGTISKEFTISDEEIVQSRRKRKKSKTQIPFGLIIFIFMMVFGRLGRGRRGGLLSALFISGMLNGGGSNRGGGSGFGGGGFGGFGGGGGGGFGGGGASGGW